MDTTNRNDSPSDDALRMESELKLLLVPEACPDNLWPRISVTMDQDCELPTNTGMLSLPGPSRVLRPSRFGVLDAVAVLAATVLFALCIRTLLREPSPQSAGNAELLVAKSERENAEMWLKWTANLTNADKDARAEAAAGLAKAGPEALPILKSARDKTPDPVTRQTIDSIRSQIYTAHPDFALKISTVLPLNRKLRLGTDTSISLIAKVQNVGDQPITILKRNDATALTDVWTIRVLDTEGNIVPMESIGKNSVKQVSQVPFEASDFVELNPGSSIEVEVQAYLFFVDPKPGIYELSVMYRLTGSVQCVEDAEILKTKSLKCSLTAVPVKFEFVMP